MNNLFNIDLGPLNNDENDGNRESPGVPYKEQMPLPKKREAYLPADKPKKPELEVTLSYLKTLEMFGSLEWFNSGRGITIGSRGLFVVGDTLSKQDVLMLAVQERTTLICEVVAMEREPVERLVFQVLPAYVVIDEDVSEITRNRPVEYVVMNVFYECSCGKQYVKVKSAQHLEALMEAGKVFCPGCGCMCDLKINEDEI